MAEVLGAVASSLQLVETAIKLGSQIYKFINNIKSAQKKAVFFRRDLDLTLNLLSEVTKHLERAKKEYRKVGDTVFIVETALENFYQELSDITISVETLYANPMKWKNKIKIGLKAESEWEKFDSKIKAHYNKLTAASVQLSNSLNIENGERINEVKSEVEAVGIEITTNVSAPLQSVQQDVRTIRDTGDTSFLLIQESIALQVSNMQRMENLHGHQFKRITEIHDTMTTNQNETAEGFNRIESGCNTILTRQEDQAKDINSLGEEIGDVKDMVQKLAEDLTSTSNLAGVDIPAQSQAVLDGIKSLKISPPSSSLSTSEPKSREDRMKLEKQKRNLSAAVRQILRLAEEPSATKLVKGADAEDYVNAVQQLLDTLQDDSETGQDLKHELTVITSQLLGTKSLYMQKAPDPSFKKKISAQEQICQSLMSEFDTDLVEIENKQLRKIKPLDNGTLIISSRTQKRTAKDDTEITGNETTLTFKPKLKQLPGESQPAWVASITHTFGTESKFSVPLLIRVHNRRFFAMKDRTTPRSLASRGDLKGLQKLFQEGLASVFDVDQYGVGLLHNAVYGLRPDQNRTKDQSENCLSVCRFLLEQGADPNLVDDVDKTPLTSFNSVDLYAANKYNISPEDRRIAEAAFREILETGVSYRASPFGPEQAISLALGNLIYSSSAFFGHLVSRLNDTEFDINCYPGCNNAIALEFATLSGDDLDQWSENLDIAIKHGADVRARKWHTEESCLHLAIARIKVIEGDFMMNTEPKWLSYKKYWLKFLSPRIRKYLSLGADIYAKDDKYLEFQGIGNINYTVTRAMYQHEVQEVWWELLAEFGFSKVEVLEKEAKELEITTEDYQTYLNGLAEEEFNQRQNVFRIPPTPHYYLEPIS
ncbi:hypothetical protein H072_10497 [Dactylellina haptotyla CBS 200.50]|uniref:Fungal N-terminal domain-containing protein n=1 Tax=Dactylellina haptotyla (strain CBS 200.50) TaxID=1284197 RepID=S8BL85_DACHA|nr:hypothetical protein H072_10497 [Dactylellina haptotyla CBS 200.50]